MMFIRNNKLFRNIYLLLDDLGIRIFVSKLLNYRCNNKYSYNISKDMLEAKTFFKMNNSNVKKVVSLLKDEKSKKTYLQMIDFRGTFNNKSLPYISYKKQYWDTDYFKYTNNEVMVDCGAYDGDSIRSFRKAMIKHRVFSFRIIAFEPDSDIYTYLISNYPNIKAFKSGVGEESELKPFKNINYGGSYVVNEKEIEKNSNEVLQYIEVKKLDEVEECQEATIIKMDIEGAEYEALLGAEKLIKKNKPKLAICIYHKDEDFIRIPLLIHEWVPEYKLYVMQHSNTIYETVLYATI